MKKEHYVQDIVLLLKEYSEKFGLTQGQSAYLYNCYGASEMFWAILLNEPIQDEYLDRVQQWIDERK